MKKHVSWLLTAATAFAALGVALPLAQAAPLPQQQCFQKFLFSDTSTLTAGHTYTDPLNFAMPLLPANYSAGALVPAVAADTTGLIPGPWLNPATHPNFMFNPGAMWISDNFHHPGQTGGDGDPHSDQWRQFRAQFSLPSNASVRIASLFYTGDNAVTVYLNGHEIASTTEATTYGIPGPFPAPNVFSNVHYVRFFPALGRMDELTFIVRNYAYPISVNPTGLLFKAEINYCVPFAS